MTAAPIGLLGGSFDPIHVGHLQLARDARDQLKLAEVRLIPAAQPWQKGQLADAAHRAEMVRLAIGAEPGLKLDLHEIARGGPTYTIDTLRELRSALGSEQPLVLIIGGDQMERLDTWREWQALLDHAHLAVARRNDQVLVLNDTLHEWFNAHWSPPEVLATQPAGRVVDLTMTPVDASGTQIRQLLGQPATPERDARLAAVLPPPVLDYIGRHHVY